MSDTINSMGSTVFVVLDVKPGFVVKTKTMGKGGGEERRRKVLVNACGAREVPKHHHPLVVSPDDFAMKFMMEGENDDDDHNKCSLSSNSWAFACGEKRKDVDGAGKECDVYDVAFNDEVVEVAKKAMFEPLGVLANDIGGEKKRIFVCR